MRLFLSFFTAVCLFCSLVACSPASSRDPFAYAEAPFSLTVEGTYLPMSDPEGTPRPFAATITAGAPVGGDPTLRDLAVTFTAPDTLADVTVTLSPAPDGTAQRSVVFSCSSDYGSIEVTAQGGEFDGFLRFAEALLPTGDVAEVSPKAADGSYTVIRRTGEREVVFAFVEGNDFPVSVRLTDGRGVVEMNVSRGGE